jgi:hypothetical protein
VPPEQPPVHADQFDVPHDPLGLLHALLIIVTTENKLKTNEQEVKKQFLEPPFAVKNKCTLESPANNEAHSKAMHFLFNPYISFS